MAAFLALILFAALVSSITAFGYVRYVRPARIIDRLASAHREAVSLTAVRERSLGETIANALAAVGKLIPAAPVDVALARRTLASAGLRSEGAVWTLYGIRVVTALGLFLIAFFTREHLTENPVLRIVMLFAGAGGGYAAPGFILGRLIIRRQEQIRFALPDVLDLLVVCS